MSKLSQLIFSQNQTSSFFSKILFGLLLIRFAVLSVRSFLPFGLPEVWRQYDTMGVAFRYWQRFLLDGFQWHDLLPAVLNAGDTNGIMPMEFPLLNLWVSPAFAFGVEWGRSLAYLLLVLTVFFLTLLNARIWSGRRILGISTGPAMLMLPLVSFSAIWSGKFMPDYLSMILACIGIGLNWNFKKRLASILLLSLSFLVKPTSVIILALYLLHPDFRTYWTRWIPNTVIPVLVSLFYYTWGINQISQLSEMPGLFALGFRPPLESLIAFLSSGRSMIRLLNQELLLPFLPLLAIPFSLWWALKKGQSKYLVLWGIILLQVLTIGVLDGTHAYTHAYYFIGVTPIAAVFLSGLWQDSSSRGIRSVLIFLILLKVLEHSWMDFKTLVRPEWRFQRAYASECTDLKARTPHLPWNQGKPFRSPQQTYPEIGMCFGEIQNSQKAPYGFFFQNKGLPDSCRAIDQSEHFLIAECRSNP